MPLKNLHKDVYKILSEQEDHDPCAEHTAKRAMNIGTELAKATLPRTSKRKEKVLWASEIGSPCLLKTWYAHNQPDKKETLEGWTKFKFLYGNILEESILFLIKEAGYDVHSEQEEVELELDNGWLVRGRIDAMVGRHLVDVKSTSTFGFAKYKKEGLTKENDTFGYLWQLAFYWWHTTLTPDEYPWIIWIDKQNGHVLPQEVPLYGNNELWNRMHNITFSIENETELEVASKAKPAHVPVPHGKSGNLKLPTTCSYCDFKRHCWRDANGGKGLRTFLYSNGPLHLVETKRIPDVPELEYDEEDTK